MPNKLPAYFEKYFDQKFEEINDRFSELKLHVNDEIEIMRITLQKVEKQLDRNGWLIAFMFVILLVHDVSDINLFEIVKSLFIK